MAISTNGVILTRLAGALYNQQLSNATYNEVLTAFNSPTALNTLANYLISTDFASKTDLQIATTLVTNLGLSSVVGLNNWVAAQLTAAGTGSKGSKIISLLNDFSNMDHTDVTYGAAVAAFNAKIDSSQALSQTTSNTGGTFTAAGTSGITFTLTTGADSFTGNSGNDTFNASLSSTSVTLDSLDALNGGAGTDTFLANLANTTVLPGSITNIETLTLTGTGGTLNLSSSSGYTSLRVSGTTTNSTSFTNINSTTPALTVANTDQSATFGYLASAVSGSADSVTVTLSNVTAGTLTINSIETVNVVSSGSANTLTGLTTDSASSVVTSGDQALTLGTLGTSVRALNASAATAGVTATAGAVATATITGGAGNDSFTISAVTGVASVNAGAGDDTIIAATNLANTDVINGGDGTADTLSTTAALAEAYTAPTTATVTNVERLTLSTAGTGAATLTTANLSTTINRVNLPAGTAGVYGVTGPAGTATVTFGTTAGAITLGGALTLTDTGTATTDAVSLNNVNTTTSTTNAFAAANLTSTGYETLNIGTGSYTTATAQTIGTIGVTPDTGGAVVVNFSGGNSITTGVITATSATSGKIDASGLTGTAIFSNTGAAPVGISTIIGGANADVLVGASSATSIDGAAGNDAITGGAGNDTLVGGDGVDTITSAAGNDNINGGAGNDSIVLAGNLATGDVIDGGADTDTISITNASLTTLNGYSISAATALNNNISNVERVTVTDAFDLNTAFDLARLKSLNYITLTAGTTGAEELSGLAPASTIVVGDDSTLTATLSDATGTADSITFSIVDLDGTPSAETVAALTTSGIETINISVTESTADATIRVATVTTLTSTGATSVVITGTESLTVTNGTALKNVDASGLSAGALTLSVANAATAATVVGGAGADVITGSANGDTITGNAGTDSIDGAAGSDTIDGGSGVDTIIGGTGNDSITAGEGADTIVAGAGNDTIVLTETTAASDVVWIGRSDTAGTNLAVASQGFDTVTGFTAGTSGDVLSYDIGGVVVTNSTAKIATLSSDGATLTSLANTAAAGDVDIVIVLGEYGSYAAVQATLNATAGAITDATDGALVVWRDGSGNTQVYFDTNISAGAGTGTQLVQLTGVATASLVAANFAGAA